MVVENIRKDLSKDAKEYINAIKKEYNKYIPSEVLNNIKDYEANKEFMSKYYCYINEYLGMKGLFKKILFYKKLNYNKAYKLIK